MDQFPMVKRRMLLGYRFSGRIYAIGCLAIISSAAACSQSDLDAAQPEPAVGRKTTATSQGGDFTVGNTAAADQPAASVADTTIEQLLKGRTAICAGTPVPTATVRPDTSLGPVPAVTPVYCPFPK
jgi:hypothetical protein